MATYKNRWHKPHDPASGPEEYVTDARPTPYKGFLIYHRHDSVWDCVIDGECRAQRAGLSGAKRFIDDFWARENAA